MSLDPFFNVIIPTRERADTLRHCLETIVAQEYPFLNILVSDNFSHDETRTVVKSFHDERITYINTGKRLGMSQNWEFALTHVAQGWVTFVGDDDGMLPGALETIARAIRTVQCKAIVSAPVAYNWPGFGKHDGLLRVPLTSGLEVRNSKYWINRLMCGSAIYPELPMVYTGGFVHKSAIDLARHPDGRFFLSSTPDVYSAVAIALAIDSYAILHEPVCIAGQSRHSNGASYLGINDNSLPAEIFCSEGNIPIHPRLAEKPSRSIPIIVYECYLQAEHLHVNNKGFSMTSQLELAIRLASDRDLTDVLNYCNATARINGLPQFEQPTTVVHIFRRVLRNVVRGFRRCIREVSIDSLPMGVTTVYDASIACSTAIHVYKRSRYWKLANMLRFMRSLLLEVAGRLRSYAAS